MYHKLCLASTLQTWEHSSKEYNIIQCFSHRTASSTKKYPYRIYTCIGYTLNRYILIAEYMHIGFIPNMYTPEVRTAIEPSSNGRICSHNNVKCKVSSNQSVSLTGFYQINVNQRSYVSISFS